MLTDLDGVTVLERVQVERARVVGRCELRPDVELLEAVVDAQVLDPRREALVQPQVRPPFLRVRMSTQADSANISVR